MEIITVFAEAGEMAFHQTAFFRKAAAWCLTVMSWKGGCTSVMMPIWHRRLQRESLFLSLAECLSVNNVLCVSLGKNKSMKCPIALSIYFLSEVIILQRESCMNIGLVLGLYLPLGRQPPEVRDPQCSTLYPQRRALPRTWEDTTIFYYNEWVSKWANE